MSCVEEYANWLKEYGEERDAKSDAVEAALAAEDVTNDWVDTCVDIPENPLKLVPCATRGVSTVSRWKRVSAFAEKSKEEREQADEAASALWACIEACVETAPWMDPSEIAVGGFEVTADWGLDLTEGWSDEPDGGEEPDALKEPVPPTFYNVLAEEVDAYAEEGGFGGEDPNP